jgi:hypothetical protein
MHVPMYVCMYYMHVMFPKETSFHCT